MDLYLEGKTALVGGGSKGLGYAAALRLAKEGVRVAICARNQTDFEHAARQIEIETSIPVIAIAFDLSEIQELKDKVVDVALEALGSIDILVINSGGPKAGEFHELDIKDWDEAYRSVFLYVRELYQHIIPHMKDQRWGRIINISSLSVREATPSLTLSNVYRSGVLSLAKAISQDLIASNITINSLMPGAFLTGRAQSLLETAAIRTGKTVKEITEESIKNLPLGRFQAPDELGAVIAFLASELAKGITGVAIPIDGGISKGIY
jgi:3-oxoacyl-[acyl-carrier protein] reductase